MSEYPAWICSECGSQNGSRIPTCATWHYDECGWCGAEEVPVTEPRDFGYPKAPGAAATRALPLPAAGGKGDGLQTNGAAQCGVGPADLTDQGGKP